MTVTRAHITGLALLLACVITMLNAGCAGRGGGNTAPGQAARPDGLEVDWWVVQDPGSDTRFESLGQVLADYATREIPASPASLASWKANGLRIVAVPPGDLDLIRARLLTIGRIQEQWYGTLPRWTPIATGPLIDAEWRLALDDATIDVPPGTMRLLCRAWMVPVEPDDPGDSSAMAAAMQVELLPQLRETESAAQMLERSYGLAKRGPTEESGQTFPRLALSLSSRGKEVFLVVPEDPGTTWEPRKAVQEAADAPADSIPIVPLPGPRLGGNPRLGEAMLADVGRTGLTRRVVLVLIPRVPDRFELLR